MAKLRRRFEPVAYFNPAVRTDARRPGPGNLYPARQHDQLPDLCRDRGPGQRLCQRPERPLVATKDFYLEPGLPGFFNQGDQFKFQVAAFNDTGDTGPVKFSAVGDGGLCPHRP